MRTNRITLAPGSLALLVPAPAAAVQAADLKVTSTTGVTSFVEELASRFAPACRSPTSAPRRPPSPSSRRRGWRKSRRKNA